MDSNKYTERSYNWKAKCPRCYNEVKGVRIRCKNCNVGTYKKVVTYYEENNSISVSYICENCGDSALILECPKCGTTIYNTEEDTEEYKITIFHVVWYLIVFAAIIYGIYWFISTIF